MMLTKYHALGNDFLVLDDPQRVLAFDAAVVSALCDRHRGIGADGVLRLSRSTAGADLHMELRNADGGEAETSGNGLRCSLLAAVHAGLLAGPALEGAPVQVETVAGMVVGRMDANGGPPGACAQVSVEMGLARVTEPCRSPVPGHKVYRVDVGNPHLVVVGPEAAALDLSVLGPALEASELGGTNVELVDAHDGELDLVVWERGVGLTLACGSGSCAGAAAARHEEMVGDRVIVHNPGGDLVVELRGPLDRPEVTLSGPACRVARVDVDLDDLLMAAGSLG